MTTYVDSSALTKLYVDEPASALAVEILSVDPVLATSMLSLVEVRRALARHFTGINLVRARELFEADLDRMALIEPTESIWNYAADIAEELGVRSLDAVHLAVAKRLEVASLRFVTFDIRQAQAARLLGLNVVGA
ncbi:MAG: type II toxin-antitoxin system VapC family toxin [Acidobacteria bacterium]|jgi:predicted nucleic acid-binding protein|nr:type II toxin-antitoxin system VapC family toxin [Acidobacteriota bacterium]